MKVKTITCHNVYNHGASLQAYALMKYLSDLNYDTEIIDYRPSYLSHHYDFLHVSNPRYRANVVLSAAYLIAKLPQRLMALPRKKSFDNFTNKYLKLTKEKYITINDLRNNPPNANAYICGSDQIWNTLHENGKDKSFYLDFGDKNSRKISYAASLATDRIYGGMEQYISLQLNQFDALSCRENSGRKLLNTIGVKSVEHVMDPAFLIDENEWNEIALNRYTEKYILIYDFENCSKIREKAILEAKKRNAKIYSINPGKFDYVDKKFDNVGPDTFLSLIRDADLVISNSFHAVVFPLIFGTSFSIIKRSENINERMEDIYRTIGQYNKYESGEVVTVDEEIRKRLKPKILASKDFVLRSLA